MKKLIAIIFAAALMLGIMTVGASAAEAPEGEPIAEESENFFAEVVEVIETNSDKILSALAFIGSIVLAFTYKRGLLPTLSKTLGSIGSSVKSIGESTEKSLCDNADTMSAINSHIKEIGELFDGLSEDVSALNKKLDSYEEDKLSAAAMSEIMRAQVDMLYEIFMTSSLPQYAKDSVGERIAKMKAQLASGEKTDE